MVKSHAIREEADRLYAVLDADEVPKKVLLSGFVEYSDASKNEVVMRVLRTYQPPVRGTLLARLLYIRTPENEAALHSVFLTNLRSPDGEARRISLVGLKELRHPGLADLALLSMRDTSDQVLTIALDLLLPHAKTDPIIWAFLQGVYASNKGKEEFYMSLSLLEAHGIASSPLTDR